MKIQRTSILNKIKHKKYFIKNRLFKAVYEIYLFFFLDTHFKTAFSTNHLNNSLLTTLLNKEEEKMEMIIVSVLVIPFNHHLK